MKLLLFLKPWLFILLLLFELEVTYTSDPNTDDDSTPSNLSQNHLNSSQDQQQCSLNQLDISKFVFLSKDEKSSSGFVEVDKTKYLLEKTDNMLIYRFKDCCKCSMLKYGDQIVWTHDFNKYGYYYPRKISINSNWVIVKMEIYKLYYTLNNDIWVLTSKTDFNKITISDFIIVTLDDDSNTRLNINNTSKYDLFTYPSGLILITFKDGAKCVEFKFYNVTIWKHKPEYGNKYPTFIVFKPDCYVYIAIDTNFYECKFDYISKNWELKLIDNFKEFGLVDPLKYPNYLKLFTADDVSATTLRKNDTTKYKVYSYFQGFYLYVFDSGVVCHEFRYKDVTLWKYNGIKYPRSISVDFNGSVVYIDFDFDSSSKLSKINQVTTSISFAGITGQPSDDVGTPVELNIKKTESSDFFNCFIDEEDDLRIYTANEGYIFNRVAEHRIVWESNDYKEYAWKVILKGTKEYPKYLLMLPSVGEFVLYYKENEDDEWCDITKDRISFSNLNIFGYDKFGFGIKQLDFIHYKISTFKFMFGYKFRQGVRCSHIKHNDVSLWSHSDLPKDSYPMGLYYDLIKKNLYLLFEYSDKHLFVSLTGPKCELVKIAVTSKTSPLPQPITPTTEIITTLGISEVVVEHKPKGTAGITGVKKEYDIKDGKESTSSDKEETDGDSVPEFLFPTSFPTLPEELLPQDYQEQKSGELDTPSKPSEDSLPSSVDEGSSDRILSTAKKADDGTPSTPPTTPGEADSTPSTVPSTPSTPSIPSGTPTTPSSASAKSGGGDSVPSTPSVPSVTPAAKKADGTPSTPSGTPESIISSEPEQLIILDISKKDSCDEYYYSRNVSEQTETFTSKPGYKFKQVNNGNDKRWEAKNNKYYTKVTLTKDDQNKLKITIGDAKSREQDAPLTLKPREEASLSSSSLKDDFKVVTLDPLDNKKTKENDTTQYDFDDGDIMLTYKFKPNSKCVQLKHGNNVIWNYDHTNHKSHPRSLHLFKTVFFFILGLRDNEFLLYGLTSNNQLECESFEGVAGISESDIKIITKDGTGTKENDTSQYEFKNLDFGFEYKFKPNSECIEVKFKNETIWKYDDIKHETYPDCIFFMSGNALVFPRDVKSKDSKSPNLVELDIGSKKSTDQYNYSRNASEQTDTFTSKAGYAFKKVFQKKNNGKLNDVWVADSANKYATKVVFNYNSKRVAITLDDNYTMLK